ncbi:Histidine-tRNA ligase/ATP phosphoribosyltransferase regulatory subunit [Corchorus olitorius]|uniref:Histidine-tRNA ligase/ATP phosphoribosyltransferase regulatory subunit n=1 Tax=Corchorus olitorius TaxID=93759 RepID=A0A1R3G0M1_9ROSI|nr:Histidine-tRNA ligase/ATP phosphoribosyltransferase regulatory subunit [Corchorus olitorius]
MALVPGGSVYWPAMIHVGSIGAGGRYDNLIGNFGTKQVPTVGMSLGIERVLTIMEDKAQNQSHIQTPTSWVPPAGNTIKLNMDASFVSATGIAKIGVVLRDSNGQVLCLGFKQSTFI